MNSNLEIHTLSANPNFATLEDSDEYTRYFQQLRRVFGILRSAYRKRKSENSYEAAAVSSFLEKLLCTLRLLRIKYAFSSDTSRPLWVDLTESGFPNFAEINALEVDRELCEERLQQLAPEEVLKRNILDFMFTYTEEPLELLYDLSQRTYFRLLQSANVFFAFSSGELELKSSDDEQNHYVYSWACYDFASNRPYFHVMTFSYDSNGPQLDTPWGIEESFLNTIRSEGSRTPDIGVLALALDDALEAVHPKILKRICLGPLYSRLLLQQQEPNTLDQREVALRHLFSKYSHRDDDFFLFFTDEIVFSKEQVITESFLSSQSKVREVFAISQNDLQCSAKRASLIHPYVLMPHDLLQHIDPKDLQKIPDFSRTRKLTFDAQGEVHGI